MASFPSFPSSPSSPSFSIAINGFRAFVAFCCVAVSFPGTLGRSGSMPPLKPSSLNLPSLTAGKLHTCVPQPCRIRPFSNIRPHSQRWRSTAVKFNREVLQRANPSSSSSSSSSSSLPSSSSWTTGRVLLFAAFTSSLTYLFGITDAASHLVHSWPKKAETPKYCSAKDLQKVCP